MSQLLLVGQASAVATPSAGQIAAFGWSTNKKLAFKDDAGVITTMGLQNTSVANNTGFAADTYLVGSNIVVAAGQFRAKTLYRCVFDMVKTGAGVAAFTVILRVGTLGTTGDGNRCQIAFAVGTAVIDTGVFTYEFIFRTVGSGTSAVVQGRGMCNHHLAATGLITTGASGTGIILTTGGGFDSTTATNIGISVNGGTSFSGTNTMVAAELLYL